MSKSKNKPGEKVTVMRFGKPVLCVIQENGKPKPIANRAHRYPVGHIRTHTIKGLPYQRVKCADGKWRSVGELPEDREKRIKETAARRKEKHAEAKRKRLEAEAALRKERAAIKQEKREQAAKLRSDRDQERRRQQELKKAAKKQKVSSAIRVVKAKNEKPKYKTLERDPNDYEWIRIDSKTLVHRKKKAA